MSTAVISQSAEFDTWAQVYDEQPNPLLALEERFLRQMMPDLRGCHILDAGCGTGRWLRELSSHAPATLTGVDTSAEMLHRAAAKLGAAATLHLGSCTALPIADSTIDLALSSFVLSYVPDLEAFASELSRITSPGANIFITDMHPDTAIARNWSRSFKVNGKKKQFQTSGHLLNKITSTFRNHGFELLTLIEPVFDQSEKKIFEQNGKLEAFESTADLPAIYILQLRKPAKPAPRLHQHVEKTVPLLLTGAIYAVGPNTTTAASIALGCGHIHSVSSAPGVSKEFSSTAEDIDLNGYLLLPGLINAHDHLEFGLFPNLGSGPYQNSAEWAQEIHRTHAALIERHRKVPKPTRLWWGAIRNLLCGVTTVCHHNPLTRELVDPGFPVRVLAKFGWAHSLAMDPNLVHNFDLTPSTLPFILHAAEGVDSKSAQEIFDLDRMQILDERTVLIHGLAVDKRSAALLNQRGVSLVICPTSNQFLFHSTPSAALIRSLHSVVLGSDSPLTASGDLLDEICFTRTHLGLDSASLYEMVTTKSARVLHLRNGEGAIRPGAAADLIAVRQQNLSPAETLARLTSEQIELVILSGRIQLASNSLYERLPSSLKEGLQPLDIDGHTRWLRAPIDTLLPQARKLLGKDLHLGRKRVTNVGAA